MTFQQANNNFVDRLEIVERLCTYSNRLITKTKIIAFQYVKFC